MLEGDEESGGAFWFGGGGNVVLGGIIGIGYSDVGVSSEGEGGILRS